MGNTKSLNILIVGVGGQGTLLASRVLGSYAAGLGLDCKLSEVHGMAQRGGSVVTHVRMGEKVHSPVIPLGEADVIISFEALEAARYVQYLKKGGLALVNTQNIMPMPVVTGSAKYPYDILDILKSEGYNVISINAAEIASQAGNNKAVNIVMLGKMASLLNLDTDNMKQAVSGSVPEKSLQINIKAFEMGCAAV